jgi:hypothetical protein
MRADEIHPRGGRVDPGSIERSVGAGLSIRQIAAELDVSYSTVRYWLRKLGLQTRFQLRRDEVARLRDAGLPTEAILACPIHGSARFVLRSDGAGYRCDRCAKEAVSERRRVVKRILVDEAGGRCSLCGYNTSIAALGFHHLDPSKKRFGLSRNGVSRSLAKARDEAKKCLLVCANCHMEVEHGDRQIPADILPVKSRPALAAQN